MSICASAIWEINIGWEQTSWLVILKPRNTSACPDLCPLFLHALLYNKTITQHPTGDGSQLLALLSEWAARTEAPRGSISKQRYRVPVAIRSGTHAKFSTLYVDWDGAKAAGRGYVLTGEPSELHYSLSNSDGSVCEFDLRARNRNINCCTYTWRNSNSCCYSSSYLSQSLSLCLPPKSFNGVIALNSTVNLSPTAYGSN